jgi:uncharacterized protein
MGLIRLLLFLAAGWLIFRLLRRVRIHILPSESPPAKQLWKGRMVRCARCGLFLPETEAITRGDQHYCRDHFTPRDHLDD